jgi:hypothetical protein
MSALLPMRLKPDMASCPLCANDGNLELKRSRLKAGPAASLASDFLVALFEKTPAFAILAFRFWFAWLLLHAFSDTALREDQRPVMPDMTQKAPIRVSKGRTKRRMNFVLGAQQISA